MKWGLKKIGNSRIGVDLRDGFVVVLGMLVGVMVKWSEDAIDGGTESPRKRQKQSTRVLLYQLLGHLLKWNYIYCTYAILNSKSHFYEIINDEIFIRIKILFENKKIKRTFNSLVGCKRMKWKAKSFDGRFIGVSTYEIFVKFSIEQPNI